MTRPKKFKDAKLVNFRMELEAYEKLETRVPSVSKFLRKCINDFLEENNNLDDLKRIRHNKIIEYEQLKSEITALDKKISEIETFQKENAENQEIQNQILETIQKVINNEYAGFGITMDRVNAINQNRLTNPALQKLITENDIKIIKTSEMQNSKMISDNDAGADATRNQNTTHYKKTNPVKEADAMTLLYNDFTQKLHFANLGNSFSSISAKEYLKKNQDVYQARCTAKNISYNDFKELVLSASSE